MRVRETLKVANDGINVFHGLRILLIHLHERRGRCMLFYAILYNKVVISTILLDAGGTTALQELFAGGTTVCIVGRNKVTALQRDYCANAFIKCGNIDIIGDFAVLEWQYNTLLIEDTIAHRLHRLTQIQQI